MMYNPPVQQGATVQIIKRPMADQEQSLALAYYNSLRNGSRGMATVSMLMAFLTIAIIAGALPLGDLIILFTIFSLVFGLSSMGIGAMTIKARGRISAALNEGTVIEVLAPAFRDQSGRKGPSWNIGPVSMVQTPELQGMLVEGAPTSVVCIPGVKAALSVNGVPLKRGAAITAPPNLAAMATVQAPAPYMPPMQAQYPAMQMQPGPYQPAQGQPPAAYAPPPQPMPGPQQPYPPQMQPYHMQTQQPMPGPQQPYPPQTPQPYPGPNMPQPFPGQTQPYTQQAPPDIPRK